MRRRKSIAGLAVAAAVPLAAGAQQKIPIVGVLWHAASAEEETIFLGALKQGFGALGYVDGKMIAREHRFPAEQPEKFVSLAAELATIPVDVLVAATKQAALAAPQVTTIIPIVLILVPEPVGLKLVNSLARPGGNIMGLTNISTELTSKRFQFLNETFPRMTRVALLVNPNDQQSTLRFIDEAKTAATALGLHIETMEVRSLEAFEQAFDRMAERRSEGVITASSGLMYQGHVLAARCAAARHLPLIAHSRETLEVGALMAHGPDDITIFRRAAGYVDKILKGQKPTDLPLEVPSNFEFLINLKTAKELGLTLSESLLLRADEVIE
jgi:putative ABC transport system substrate-binding protein